MEDGDDVLEHINKLRTLAEQLDAVGAPVSDEDLAIVDDIDSDVDTSHRPNQKVCQKVSQM